MTSTKKTTDVGYKLLLIECTKLREAGGRSAYQRAKKLIAVFDDVEFRADAADTGAIDDWQLAEKLDQYVSDLAVTFFELRDMIAFAPDEKRWADGKLKTLLAECVADREERRRIERAQAQTQRKQPAVVSRKVHEQALAKERFKTNKVQAEKAEVETKLGERIATLEEEHSKDVAARVEVAKAKNQADKLMAKAKTVEEQLVAVSAERDALAMEIADLRNQLEKMTARAGSAEAEVRRLRHMLQEQDWQPTTA